MSPGGGDVPPTRSAARESRSPGRCTCCPVGTRTCRPSREYGLPSPAVAQADPAQFCPDVRRRLGVGRRLFELVTEPIGEVVDADEPEVRQGAGGVHRVNDGLPRRRVRGPVVCAEGHAGPLGLLPPLREDDGVNRVAVRRREPGWRARRQVGDPLIDRVERRWRIGGDVDGEQRDRAYAVFGGGIRPPAARGEAGEEGAHLGVEGVSREDDGDDLGRADDRDAVEEHLRRGAVGRPRGPARLAGAMPARGVWGAPIAWAVGRSNPGSPRGRSGRRRRALHRRRRRRRDLVLRPRRRVRLAVAADTRRHRCGREGGAQTRGSHRSKLLLLRRGIAARRVSTSRAVRRNAAQSANRHGPCDCSRRAVSRR